MNYLFLAKLRSMKTSRVTLFLILICLGLTACPPSNSLEDPDLPIDDLPTPDLATTKFPLTTLPFTVTTGTCTRCQGVDPKNIKVAAIIEPRPLDILITIVQAVSKQLPSDWIIQIFHGTKNVDFINNSALAPDIQSGRIILSKMEVDNLTIQDYNLLLLNQAFWSSIVGENILTFETDSVTCSNSTSTIDQFASFDYIGAPWGPSYGCAIYKNNNSGLNYTVYAENPDEIARYQTSSDFTFVSNQTSRVGNSGFSFKKRSKMISLLQKYLPVSSLYYDRASDLFLGCVAQDPNANMNLPSVDVAQTFSVETVYYATPFGIHKPWWYMNADQLDKLAVGCPELNTIMKTRYWNSEEGWQPAPWKKP